MTVCRLPEYGVRPNQTRISLQQLSHMMADGGRIRAQEQALTSSPVS